MALKNFLDRGSSVDDLVDGDSGHGGTEDDAGHVAACLGRRQPDVLEAPPDLGYVLDTNPVKLDVLPIGDVCGVARELG